MAGFNWQCPFCNAYQTVTEDKFQEMHYIFKLRDSSHPEQLGSVQFLVGCSNNDCGRLSLNYAIYPTHFVGGQGRVPQITAPPFYQKRLLPDSFAKPQPDYIPVALRQDYNEACLIRDLSPKAAATLARRCLQGMIRDYCLITRKTLFQEIGDLKKAVDEGGAPSGVTIESVDAIDNVRGIGNIGAHMESDINIIVDVDGNEVQLLIELIESLFEEWYVARHKRHARFASIAQVAREKQIARQPAPTALPRPDE